MSVAQNRLMKKSCFAKIKDIKDCKYYKYKFFGAQCSLKGHKKVTYT